MPIFTLDQKHAGSFKADALKLTFDGKSLGSLAQSLNLTFTQQVTMMYEVGSPNVYYVGGRAQGQAQLQRVIGPRGGDVPVEGYGDICKPKDIEIAASSGDCESGNDVKYTMEGTILVSLGLSVQSQDVVINQQLGYMFIDLVKNGGGGPSGVDGNPAAVAGVA